jgi:hypothetical protein
VDDGADLAYLGVLDVARPGHQLLQQLVELKPGDLREDHAARVLVRGARRSGEPLIRLAAAGHGAELTVRHRGCPVRVVVS